MLISLVVLFFVFFFFNDTATTEIYTLSLHDALPIRLNAWKMNPMRRFLILARSAAERFATRSEEHTSELQSPVQLVCRPLLEKKKKKAAHTSPTTTPSPPTRNGPSTCIG